MDDTASRVAQRQRQPKAVRYQRAARSEYDRAILYRRLETWPRIALAAAGPLAVLFFPDLGRYLGALAAGWLLLSKLVFAQLVRRRKERGALWLEEFDCYVFAIPWNAALGERLAGEEAIEAAMRVAAPDSWYPDPKSHDRVREILACQRVNAVWSRRQHQLYAQVVAALAISMMTVGILVSVLKDASLADYLVTVALPSLAALVTAVEVRTDNLETVRKRQDLERVIDRSLQMPPVAPQVDEVLRGIQDRIYDFRVQSPLIPPLIYRLMRGRYNQSMQVMIDSHADE